MELTHIKSAHTMQSFGLFVSHNLSSSPLQSIPRSESSQRVTYDTKVAPEMSATIHTVSQLQHDLQFVSKKIELLDKMEQIVHSSSSQATLNGKQPKIESLINQYNKDTYPLSANIQKIVEEKQSDDSRIYFDGILGAKPLSADEIFGEIQSQKEKLSYINEKLNNKIIQQTKEAYNLLQDFQPKKFSFDFAKESENFTIQNIKNINGETTEALKEPHFIKGVELLSL